jgi:hypothetical protein
MGLRSYQNRKSDLSKSLPSMTYNDTAELAFAINRSAYRVWLCGHKMLQTANIVNVSDD